MGKNIVICSDGTGQNGLSPTNVSRLFSLLDLADPASQIACYDAGVGVRPARSLISAVDRADPGVLRVRPTTRSGPLPRPIRQLAGLAVGHGVFENVREMYELLADRYCRGDELFLFGFSRGAFTVRVLAGLLFRCGLLRPEHLGRYEEAFRLYTPHYERLSPLARRELQTRVHAFRTRYCQSVERIRFLGIWDTVKSVGYLWPKSLPHTRRNPIVQTVRHALSLREARSFFSPTTWGGLDSDSEAPDEDQDVMEVWFAGDHSDVGGGHPGDPGDLPLISLRWMVDEARRCGLRFDESRLEQLYPASWTPRRLVHHDLLGNRAWRLVEYVPRWELRNDPPPPRRLPRWGPTGKRNLSGSARNHEVLIDSHARQAYGTGPCPWGDLNSDAVRVRFVDICGDSAAGPDS